MRVGFFIFLMFNQLALAEAAGPLIIRVAFPGSAAEEASSVPVYDRLVTPLEMETWKKRLVTHLFDSNVRQTLSNKDELRTLPTLDTTTMGGALFLGQIANFASDRNMYIELGLFDGLSVASLRSLNPTQSPFAVDFSVPREPFKKAIKEILYSAGYIEGLDELFAAVAKAKAQSGVKIGLFGVAKKAAALKVAVGAFRQASTFLETGTVESLEKQQWMEKIAPQVDKYLDEDLEVWARIFCVFTKAQ